LIEFKLPRFLAAVFLSIVIYLIILYFYRFSTAWSGILISLAFMLLFFPVPFTKDLFHPFIIFISIEILFLINILDKDLSGTVIRYTKWISEESQDSIIIYSVLIITIWYIFFYCGYFTSLNIRSKCAVRISMPQINNPVKLGLIFFTLSVLGFIYALSYTGGFRFMIIAMSNRRAIYSGLGYLRKIVSLGCLASMLFLCGGYTKLSLVSVALTTIMVALFGGRSAAFFGIIFPYLLSYNYVKRKISTVNAFLMALLGVNFGLIWGNLRMTGKLIVIRESLAKLIRLIAQGTGGGDNLPALVGSLLNHQIDYKYGKTLINILFAPIPRKIWTSKPIIDETGIIGNVLMGSKYWGLPSGPYGLAFFNFSWFGVIFFSFLTGFLIQKLYQNFILNQLGSKDNYSNIIFYSLIIRSSFNIFATSAQIDFIWYIGVFLLLYLMDKFLSKYFIFARQ